MSQYLINSNWRLDLSYLLQELHLDENGITDADFATILDGLCVQQQLKVLVYRRNGFGIESVKRLA